MDVKGVEEYVTYLGELARKRNEEYVNSHLAHYDATN